MRWDDAFFARSEIEPLLWTDDPGDRPLVKRVPGFLIARACGQSGGGMFTSKRKKRLRPVSVSVVRGGRRRVLVPLQLHA